MISLKRTDGDVEAEIEDTAMGISTIDQEKIFTKFFRSDKAMKIDTDGRGLGLFIAKNIIETHGGKIWVESKENVGSTFYFTLPIKSKFAEYVTGEFY